MPRRINIWAQLATLGPIGYFAASGTVATFITLPFMYALRTYVPQAGTYISIVFAVFILSLIIVKRALPCFNLEDDPSEIVLDEVVGCLLAFWAVSLTTQSIVIGFVLFRALDIIKFGWVKRAEALADAWGVMGDDIVAALITNLILRLLYPL